MPIIALVLGRKPALAWSHVRTVLNETNGQKEAAARLGVSRQTLYAYVAKHAPNDLKRPRGRHARAKLTTSKRRAQTRTHSRRLIPVMPSGLTRTLVQQALAKNNGSVLHTAVALGIEFGILYEYLQKG